MDGENKQAMSVRSVPTPVSKSVPKGVRRVASVPIGVSARNSKVKVMQHEKQRNLTSMA